MGVLESKHSTPPLPLNPYTSTPLPKHSTGDRPLTSNKNNKPLLYHQLWNSFWLLFMDCLILIAALLLGNFILYLIQGIPLSI
jgi:hypothetical protein